MSRGTTNNQKEKTAPDNHKKAGETNMLNQKEDNVYMPHLRALSLNLESLQDDGLLNSNERRSISSLIAYAAYDKGVDTEVVQSLLETRFSVCDVEKLKSNDYDAIVRYLVDLKINEVMN